MISNLNQFYKLRCPKCGLKVQRRIGIIRESTHGWNFISCEQPAQGEDYYSRDKLWTAKTSIKTLNLIMGFYCSRCGREFPNTEEIKQRFKDFLVLLKLQG